MLDVEAFGLNAGAHHLTNVLLHIVNALLLFGLLHRMTQALGRSAFVAALFAVHPLHVESVAWVSERKDILSTLFGILTMWAYVNYVRQPRRDRYLLVLLFFALSLMAKPMLVTLPFVLLLLDIWPLGRVPLSAGEAPAEKQWFVWLRLFWEKLPLFVFAAASSIVTLVAQQEGGALRGFQEFEPGLRVSNAFVSYIAYITQMLWPARLSAFYPYPQSHSVWWLAASILGLIGVSVLVIRRIRFHPYLLVGWLWYLGTLIPVIGLVQVGTQAMADRYTYVPLIGLFLAIGWGVPNLLSMPYRRSVLPAGAVAAVLACSIVARSQVPHWRNSVALWTHALQVNSENYLAHNNLGIALAAQGRSGEAVPHFVEAVRLKPDYAEGYYNLGLALSGQGKDNEALDSYAEAVRLNPSYVDAQHNLGAALYRQGRINEAITHYAEAVRLEPDFAEGYNGLCASLLQQEKAEKAIPYCTEAIRRKPDFAEAQANLGVAMSSQGRISEAITYYAEAIRLKPDYVAAYNNLGVALARQGSFEEAITQYTEALRRVPDFVEVHNNLGVALLRQGRLDEAVAHFTEALRLRPNFVEAHNNLGEALSGQGKVREAVAHHAEALRLDPVNERAQKALHALNTPRQGSRPLMK